MSVQHNQYGAVDTMALARAHPDCPVGSLIHLRFREALEVIKAATADVAAWRKAKADARAEAEYVAGAEYALSRANPYETPVRTR